ncbi:MAG: hypothetical protein KIS29_10420 [Thermoplasmata archaeon]|nr:hypothetical protein [Candidatus Sysuiplasma jiujiangense]
MKTAVMETEIIQYLKEALSDSEVKLFDYLDATDYGTISDSAFEDEGKEVECDICHFTAGEADSEMDYSDALHELKDHLAQRHKWEIILKELRKALLDSDSKKDQAIFTED